MTVVLEPTVHDLQAERERLLAGSPFTEAELRERAAYYSLTPNESRLLRRLEEIAFLLGGTTDLGMAAPKTLADHAEAFATELTGTFRGVFGSTMPEFVAEASPRRHGTTQRLLVHPKGSVDICLEIDGAHALTLICDYHCVWDHQSTYLKVTKANIHVRPASDTTPLFRYEFEDGMQAAFPCAHLQVHAHRDEFMFAMLRAGKGKPATRAKAATGEWESAPPRLSNLHFPLGGPRMRPCVEDVLQMLVSEFAVATAPGAQAVLDEGRARWRRHQIGASVRDAPAEAVRVLESMGYTIEGPNDGPPDERLDRLTRF